MITVTKIILQSAKISKQQQQLYGDVLSDHTNHADIVQSICHSNSVLRIWANTVNRI
jgi:hypothetical protein